MNDTTAERPSCPTCGAKLAKRSHHFAVRDWVRRDEVPEDAREPLPTELPGVFVDSSLEWMTVIYDTARALKTRAQCQRLTNLQVISLRRAGSAQPGNEDQVVGFTAWSPERGYLATAGYFCSGPCALAYAQASFAATGRRFRQELTS